MMADAGAMWPFSMDKGPRCGGVAAVTAGAVDDFDRLLSLRRFSAAGVLAAGSNSDGAAGASTFLEDQTPSL